MYVPSGICPKCSYPIDPGQCPECGSIVSADQLLSDSQLSIAKERRRWLKRLVILLIVFISLDALFWFWRVPARSPFPVDMTFCLWHFVISLGGGISFAFLDSNFGAAALSTLILLLLGIASYRFPQNYVLLVSFIVTVLFWFLLGMSVAGLSLG